MSENLEMYYRHKTILITGATGFVGKAILWNLLRMVGTVIDKVYVLIRPKRIPAGTPSQRLIDEIINTPAFNQLLVYFNNDKEALRRKLIPISYDLSLPQMGLSMEDNIQMTDTNIAIHCASTSEYESSLEWNLETNVLGTVRLMEYLDSLSDFNSFIYLSPIHIYQDVPDFCYDCEIMEYVYDLGFGDPETFLKQLLGANEKELSNLVKRILQKYSTLHLFTKALVEHLILQRVDHMKNEKSNYPITIFRSNYIGPATKDPVPGWTSGMSTVSLWLALFGHSVPTIQPDQGQKFVNVIPVDYVSRCIVNAIPHIKYPEGEFILPLAQIVKSINPSDSNVDNEKTYFPYIFNISTSTKPITWYEAYSAIYDYWSRPNNQIILSNPKSLLKANDYFSTNTTISNAKFLLQYYFRSSSSNNLVNKPTMSNMNSNFNGQISFYGVNGINSNKVDIFQHQDQQKWMELASNIRNNLTKQNRQNWKYNFKKLDTLFHTAMEDEKLNFLRQDMDWYNYFMQSCYGVHVHTLHRGLHLRTSVSSSSMDCALYSKINDRDSTIINSSISIIDFPFRSVIYTVDEMKQRVNQMTSIVINSLKNPAISMQTEKQWKPIWIEYLNDILEDWCSVEYLEFLKKETNIKGLDDYWKLKVHDNSESTKLFVLNDAKVGEAIYQVSNRSGMPIEKITDEAKKTLNRIQERTQISYKWFAASFLQQLFKKLFSGIYLDKKCLEKVLKAVDQKKKIIYVPVSKTALDPVIVWLICIRYNLPVPTIVLDEALALLGPFSDLLRLSGAVFIKRDPNSRSTLGTAVTSSYLRHLLKEHGALTFILDKVRSRTGIIQPPFNDGLIEMIIHDQDIAFIPINICHEEILDITHLVDQDLQQSSKKKSTNSSLNTLQHKRQSSSNRISAPQRVSRPSDSRSQRVRSRSLNTGIITIEETTQSNKQIVHYGKLLVGIGNTIYVTEKNNNVHELLDTIQKEQKKAIIISPVSIVTSILLYSRIKGNSIELEEIKNQLTYLVKFTKSQNLLIDVQDFESSESIVFYSIRLLEKGLPTVTLDERNSGFMFRLSNRTDCSLQLAYYANQLREIFILDSIFAVTYLSFGTRIKVAELVFFERFEFLTKLFQHHFNSTCDIEHEYNILKNRYSDCISYTEDDAQDSNNLDKITEEENSDDNVSTQDTNSNNSMMKRLINKLENSKRYNQLNLLASFINPIIDTYWVTLCALSALDFVDRLPVSLVPSLSQWIGVHLISGRRTIYNEVLSIEYHQNVLRTLLLMNVLSKESAKAILSPDTQMLMQVLGLSTNDQLVFQTITEKDDEAIALNPIVELCKKIEQVRIKLEDSPVSIHIYEKCQNQIKNLIKVSIGNKPFFKSYGANITDPKEESMVQLGYALIQSMNTTY